jgi:DNA-binding NarL/FixJ family response regulator
VAPLAVLLGQEPDIEVVAQAGTGVAAIDAARSVLPDVAVLDAGSVGSLAMLRRQAVRRRTRELCLPAGVPSVPANALAVTAQVER